MTSKIFSCILAVYIALLIAMPCVDGLAGSHDNATVVSVAGENSHHHDCDFCSPFCICNCCSTTTLSTPFLTFIQVQLPAQPVISEALTAFVPPPATSVWQPPKQS